jgi:osmotically inducible protein OsmC
MKRKAYVVWRGDGENGSGELTTGSGAIQKLPYDFKMRFKNDDGKLGTNPEELIAAAHAGCFNMKLSFVLNENGFSPESLETESVLTFVDGIVESIELSLSAKVPDISDEKFNECAEEAKDNCPISGLLNCKISLSSTLI